MAVLDFPNSPTLDQVYTANGSSWKWNGTVWLAVAGQYPTLNATTPIVYDSVTANISMPTLDGGTA